MARSAPAVAWVLSLACASVTFACSQQATLRVRDGTEHRGRILRNDGKHVLIDDERGRIFSVERNAVVDVDQPGVPAMITGGAVIAAGALLAYGIATSGCHQNDKATCGEQESADRAVAWGVLAFHAVPGAGLLLYGGLVRAVSFDNYETVRGPSVVRPANSNPTPGLTLRGSF